MLGRRWVPLTGRFRPDGSTRRPFEPWRLSSPRRRPHRRALVL